MCFRGGVCLHREMNGSAVKVNGQEEGFWDGKVICNLIKILLFSSSLDYPSLDKSWPMKGVWPQRVTRWDQSNQLIRAYKLIRIYFHDFLGISQNIKLVVAVFLPNFLTHDLGSAILLYFLPSSVYSRQEAGGRGYWYRTRDRIKPKSQLGRQKKSGFIWFGGFDWHTRGNYKITTWSRGSE